jgi:hypothetical protein
LFVVFASLLYGILRIIYSPATILILIDNPTTTLYENNHNRVYCIGTEANINAIYYPATNG